MRIKRPIKICFRVMYDFDPFRLPLNRGRWSAFFLKKRPSLMLRYLPSPKSTLFWTSSVPLFSLDRWPILISAAHFHSSIGNTKRPIHFSRHISEWRYNSKFPPVMILSLFFDPLSTLLFDIPAKKTKHSSISHVKLSYITPKI